MTVQPLKIVCVLGEPGSGKSTLMRHVMEKLGKFDQVFTEVKLVPYHINLNTHVVVLGKYEAGEVFAGTDRLSMACQGEVVKFLATTHAAGTEVVLFEGDRLANQSFLEHCHTNYDTVIVYLDTNKDVRKARYAERGSNQNETWLAGRETKISNILSNLELKFITTEYLNNTEIERDAIVESIVEHIT